MALPVKDGNGSLTSLKTTLSGSDHMPHHIVQAVSGSVTVTSSLSNPVYVTGAVQILQPVSVDVVVGDNIFVTSSLSAPLYVSSSANSPILVTGTINAAGTLLTDIKDSVAPFGFAFQGSGGKNYVLVTSSLAAPVYVSSSANSPILVTGTVALQNNILTASINNENFQQVINNASASFYALPTGLQSIMVKVTASNDAEPIYIRGTASIGASTYGYTGGSALVVRTTASSVSLEGINTIFSSIGSPTTGVAVGLIGQDNSVRLYNSTSSVTSSQAFPLYVTGSVLTTLTDNTVRVSSSSGERIWVTGSVSSNASVTVSDGLKVELSGTNVKQISGSSTNTYLQTSIAPVATGSALKVFAPPNWGGSVPSGDPNVIILDWNSVESGSACAASASVERKSLTVFNNSPHNVYFVIGIPWGGPTSVTNGFSLYSTSSSPNMCSFILYPSGTYFAEPHNVGMRHGIYLVSGSVDNGTRILVTETY